MVDETELNAMVIDVKNDEGKITWKMDLECARSIGACTPYIPDIEMFMENIKEHQVYTIARIVCFKDPCLAEGRPELALKKADGTAVTDANGMAWVNPYKEEVWEYLTDVAEKAAEAGFDEIQFDYVRFPIGSDADAAVYGVNMDVNTKQQAVSGFLNYAVQKLHEKDIVVTADVFGTIIGSQTDVERVGRVIEVWENVWMCFPPWFIPLITAVMYLGWMYRMQNRIKQFWLHWRAPKRNWKGYRKKIGRLYYHGSALFTATWVNGHISYEGEEIRQQIRAVYDAGYDEWILWNAVNRYSAEGLLKETGTVQE